jgi:ribosome-binding factor A
MTSRRAQKVAEAIREVVSMAILAELKDPRVKNVTVTHVEVTGDLRQAKVYVSVMGNETTQGLVLRGLQNSAGFLQAKCARRIDTRYTPRLQFVLDQGVKKSIAVAKILAEVLPKEPPPEGEADAGMPGDSPPSQHPPPDDAGPVAEEEPEE